MQEKIKDILNTLTAMRQQLANAENASNVVSPYRIVAMTDIRLAELRLASAIGALDTFSRSASEGKP